MNSRSSSFSVQTPRRPNLTDRAISRRLSAISTAASRRNGAPTVSAEQEITEEIEEIKRYEDFTTIDWVQDAAQEQIRRRARRREELGAYRQHGILGWKRKVWELYDAGQAWIVVTLVGAAIGLNAAFLNIVTEWLSDVKLGYCETAFYLNEQFCCWGADNGMVVQSRSLTGLTRAGCEHWHPWTSLWPVNFLLYLIFSVRLPPCERQGPRR